MEKKLTKLSEIRWSAIEKDTMSCIIGGTATSKTDFDPTQVASCQDVRVTEWNDECDEIISKCTKIVCQQ